MTLQLRPAPQWMAQGWQETQRKGAFLGPSKDRRRKAELGRAASDWERLPCARALSKQTAPAAGLLHQQTARGRCHWPCFTAGLGRWAHEASTPRSGSRDRADVEPQARRISAPTGLSRQRCPSAHCRTPRNPKPAWLTQRRGLTRTCGGRNAPESLDALVGEGVGPQ